MKDSRWRGVAGYLLLAIVLYATFLVVTLPAYWLAKGVDQTARGAVVLQSASGTIWNGEAQLAVGGARGNAVARLRWRLSALWLLLGRARIVLDVQGTELSGLLAASVGFGSLALDDVDLTIPASLVGRVYPAAGFLDPEGRVQLQTTSLDWRRGELSGQATLSWLSAGLRNYRLSQLGDYSLRLNGHGNVVEVQLATVRGDLDLSGQGQWRADNGGILRLQGHAEAKARHQELEPLLALLGGNAGDSRRQFSLNLPLPL